MSASPRRTRSSFPAGRSFFSNRRAAPYSIWTTGAERKIRNNVMGYAEDRRRKKQRLTRRQRRTGIREQHDSRKRRNCAAPREAVPSSGAGFGERRITGIQCAAVRQRLTAQLVKKGLNKPENGMQAPRRVPPSPVFDSANRIFRCKNRSAAIVHAARDDWKLEKALDLSISPGFFDSLCRQAMADGYVLAGLWYEIISQRHF